MMMSAIQITIILGGVALAIFVMYSFHKRLFLSAQPFFSDQGLISGEKFNFASVIVKPDGMFGLRLKAMWSAQVIVGDQGLSLSGMPLLPLFVEPVVIPWSKIVEIIYIRDFMSFPHVKISAEGFAGTIWVYFGAATKIHEKWMSTKSRERPGT
jgi:hypothetical protein